LNVRGCAFKSPRSRGLTRQLVTASHMSEWLSSPGLQTRH